jgi:hypothetical protein
MQRQQIFGAVMQNNLVDEILAAKAADPQADTTALDGR